MLVLYHCTLIAIGWNAFNLNKFVILTSALISLANCLRVVMRLTPPSASPVSSSSFSFSWALANQAHFTNIPSCTCLQATKNEVSFKSAVCSCHWHWEAKQVGAVIGGGGFSKSRGRVQCRPCQQSLSTSNSLWVQHLANPMMRTWAQIFHAQQTNVFHVWHANASNAEHQLCRNA